MIQQLQPVLLGVKVVLRDIVRKDIDTMACWPRFAEPDLQWANLDLTTERDRDAFFERGKSNYNRRRFSIFSQSGRMVGTVGLRNIDFIAREGTLGIIIRADEVGRGYGGDAIRRVVEYAFGQLELRRVILDVAETNTRARRCYQRVGFVETGQHVGPGGLVFTDMAITPRELDSGHDGTRAGAR